MRWPHPTTVVERSPLLGEHTDDVLRQLGYTAEDVARLRAAGATEVVPEAVEGSLMLASHALALVPGSIVHKFTPRLAQSANMMFRLLRAVRRSYPVRSSRPARSNASSTSSVRSKLNAVAPDVVLIVRVLQ